MYAIVTNFDFYLSSFDANISYDDVLQSAQAAELQHGSSSQAVGVMTRLMSLKRQKANEHGSSGQAVGVMTRLMLFKRKKANELCY
jgi:hypothetical protein